jgi:hypothetical protein
MAGLPLLSTSDAVELYHSELLAGLLGPIKFWPKEGMLGWGNFSQQYLEKLLVYARAKTILWRVQEFKATQPFAPPISTSQKAKNKQLADAQSSYMASLGKKIDLASLNIARMD